MFYTLFWNLDNSSALYNFFVIVKMMPEVSIYYLMAIFRVFLLIIGQKQNFSVIASTKNGIDMKCHDSLKPLCETVKGVAALKTSARPCWKIVYLSQDKCTRMYIQQVTLNTAYESPICWHMVLSRGAPMAWSWTKGSKTSTMCHPICLWSSSTLQILT